MVKKESNKEKKKNDLKDILNKASSTKGLTSLVEVNEQSDDGTPVKKGRQSESMMDILHFDIQPTDNLLVSSLKDYINHCKITRSDIYKVIPRSEGYNMCYSLKKGQLQWDRVEKWLAVLNSRVAISFFKEEDED